MRPRTNEERKEKINMSNCIFCKIIAGEIPSKKVYEDDSILVFRDINPQAPVHVLMVPKEHIPSANEIAPETAAVAGHIFAKVGEIATLLGVADSGYRVINNCGVDGGQTVAHLHFHLLGGRSLGEGLV